MLLPTLGRFSRLADSSRWRLRSRLSLYPDWRPGTGAGDRLGVRELIAELGVVRALSHQFLHTLDGLFRLSFRQLDLLQANVPAHIRRIAGVNFLKLLAGFREVMLLNVEVRKGQASLAEGGVLLNQLFKIRLRLIQFSQAEQRFTAEQPSFGVLVLDFQCLFAFVESLGVLPTKLIDASGKEAGRQEDGLARVRDLPSSCTASVASLRALVMSAAAR